MFKTKCKKKMDDITELVSLKQFCPYIAFYNSLNF